MENINSLDLASRFLEQYEQEHGQITDNFFIRKKIVSTLYYYNEALLKDVNSFNTLSAASNFLGQYEKEHEHITDDFFIRIRLTSVLYHYQDKLTRDVKTFEVLAKFEDDENEEGLWVLIDNAPVDITINSTFEAFWYKITIKKLKNESNIEVDKIETGMRSICLLSFFDFVEDKEEVSNPFYKLPNIKSWETEGNKVYMNLK